MKPPYIYYKMTKTPPPPIWLTGRERHTTPPLQPLCNKATKQTKTISLSLSLSQYQYTSTGFTSKWLAQQPLALMAFTTLPLTTSHTLSPPTTIQAPQLQSQNSSTTNTKTSGLGLGFPFCSSSSCFFYVLSALYVIGQHFVNLEQLRTITITILYDTFKPIFFLIQV